jgi:hypothetical protein
MVFLWPAYFVDDYPETLKQAKKEDREAEVKRLSSHPENIARTRVGSGAKSQLRQTAGRVDKGEEVLVL